jgi:hypothetical protein
MAVRYSRGHLRGELDSTIDSRLIVTA